MRKIDWGEIKESSRVMILKADGGGGCGKEGREGNRLSFWGVY